MKRISLVILLLLCFSFFSVPSLLGGELDPSFAQTLKLKPKDTFLTGVVHLKEKVDLQALTQSLLYPVRFPAKERHERVIRALQDLAQRTQRPLIELLDQWSEQDLVKSYTAFWIANAIGVTAKPKVFYELVAREEVEIIFSNPMPELIRPVGGGPAPSAGRGIEPGIEATNAPDLWNMGIKGGGTIVCNIDTGVDGNHSAFASRWRGKDPGVTHDEAWFDPVTHTTFPQDFNGHGTHTMGTICGDDGGSNQIGMAPEAKWIAAATIDRVSLEQTKLDAYASFQWCADPDGDPGTYDDVPAVSSNSWRFSPLYHGVPKGWDYFWGVIDACEAAGCAVVFAAGNEGYYGSESIGTPSDRITSPVNVFSVGALEVDQKTRADFSSLGPSGVDHFTKKPEVMAHGDDVRSAIMGGGYGYKSGTSMSTPCVAGGVALLKCGHPDATPYEIKAALLYTAKDLGPSGEDNEYGRGIIDVLAAHDFLAQALIADTKELSLTSQQNEVIFSLHGDLGNAGRPYLMVGTTSGTSPGTTLPGGLVLPINWDVLTDITIIYTNSQLFQNFSGTLDSAGNAMALLSDCRPPSPAFIGVVLSFAFCTMPPPAWDFVSNPWDVEITL